MGTREYIFPRFKIMEKQRLCQLVAAEGSTRFLIHEGRVKVFRDNEWAAPLSEVETDMPSGVYFCGAFNSRNVQCAPAKTDRLDRQACGFIR